MATIKIYFIGICTHIRTEAAQVPGMKHRVVLVNGRAPRRINGSLIEPHIPTLRIRPSDLVVNGQPAQSDLPCTLDWDLRGTRVDIANAIGDLQYDAKYDCCIPHLSKLTPDLPPPSKEVILGADAAKASCYFDVTAGMFSAGYVAEGAATAVLTVTTDDMPILRIRRFRESGEQQFQLADGSEIAIANVGINDTDDENDFLLHYETAESIPENAGVPSEVAPCCEKLASHIIPARIAVGPQCSNSDFP